MTTVSVKINADDLVRWAKDLTAYRMRLALKNAINRAGRAARKQFGEDAGADIGVSAARARKSISKFRSASPGSLRAEFDAGSQRIGIKSVTGASITKGTGLTASTHRTTGGGSSRLNVAKAFLIRANGGQVVMIRTGKGRKAVKGVFAETPRVALAQDDAAPRKAWEKNAGALLQREIETGLAAVLNRGSPPSDSGSND